MEALAALAVFAVAVVGWLAFRDFGGSRVGSAHGLRQVHEGSARRARILVKRHVVEERLVSEVELRIGSFDQPTRLTPAAARALAAALEAAAKKAREP